MKKLFYLLMALPMMAFVSCSDDDDMPEVNMSVDIENATNVDGTLYVVQGDTLIINSVNVSSPDATKGIALGGVNYILDYQQVFFNPIAPYTFKIATDMLPISTHLLQLQTNVYAVDYSPMYAWISYPVKVVASQDDIPSGGTQGGTYNIKPDLKVQ